MAVTATGLQMRNTSLAPSRAIRWGVRGAVGMGTHCAITRSVSRDWQPLALILTGVLSVVFAESDDPSLQAVGHGLLGGTASGTIQYFWPDSSQAAC